MHNGRGRVSGLRGAGERGSKSPGCTAHSLVIYGHDRHIRHFLFDRVTDSMNASVAQPIHTQRPAGLPSSAIYSVSRRPVISDTQIWVSAPSCCLHDTDMIICASHLFFYFYSFAGVKVLFPSSCVSSDVSPKASYPSVVNPWWAVLYQ